MVLLRITFWSSCKSSDSVRFLVLLNVAGYTTSCASFLFFDFRSSRSKDRLYLAGLAVSARRLIGPLPFFSSPARVTRPAGLCRVGRSVSCFSTFVFLSAYLSLCFGKFSFQIASNQPIHFSWLQLDAVDGMASPSRSTSRVAPVASPTPKVSPVAVTAVFTSPTLTKELSSQAVAETSSAQATITLPTQIVFS